MPDVKFTIDPEEAKLMVREALMGAMTPEKRDELLREAIEQLLKGSWTNASELQRMFTLAAGSVAQKICIEEFDKPELRAKIRELVLDSVNRLFNDKDLYDKLSEKLSDAIGRALIGRDY
jgi:hypothetical protein